MGYVLYALWLIAFAIVIATCCFVAVAAAKVIWVCALFVWEMAL
jgi:hypothetical protein